MAKGISKQAAWVRKKPLAIGLVIHDKEQVVRLDELRRRYGGMSKSSVLRIAIDFLYEHGDPLSVKHKMNARPVA